jgi:hypothetical protein
MDLRVQQILLVDVAKVVGLAGLLVVVAGVPVLDLDHLVVPDLMDLRVQLILLVAVAKVVGLEGLLAVELGHLEVLDLMDVEGVLVVELNSNAPLLGHLVQVCY